MRPFGVKNMTILSGEQARLMATRVSIETRMPIWPAASPVDVDWRSSATSVLWSFGFAPGYRWPD
jgi:hypothetical protein